MIDQDGNLTYTNRDSILFSWSIGNATLNTVVIALLSTIIALQGTATVFDLVLGFKKRGTFKLHDLHIYLLSTEFSITAVLDAMFRSDWITRKRLRGDIPRGTSIYREPKKIRPIVYARLLLLLFVGPLLNIVVISLSLEGSQTYTFGDAGFGGLALGVDIKSQVQLELESFECSSAGVNFGRTDSAITTFHACLNLDLDAVRIDNSDDEALLIVSVLNSGSFVMSIWNETNRVSLDYRGEVRHPGAVLWIKPEVSEKDLHDLANIGLVGLQKLCGDTFRSEGLFELEEQTFVRYRGTCNSLPYDNKVDALFAMSKFLTFKNAKEFLVVNFLDIPSSEENIPVPYVSANGVPFFRRTRGKVSLLLLVIIMVIVITLRIFIRLWVAYNDFPVATEIIVRDRFDLPACDSMLHDDTVVEYRKKFQLVDMGHFGISSKDGFPEVPHYSGGAVR